MSIRQNSILIFLPFLTLGGAESQGFLLAQGLQQKGYDVTVCGFALSGSDYPLIALLDKNGLKHHVLPFEMKVMPGRKSMLRALWQFQRYLRSKQFSAVIPFTFWPNYLTAHAARFSQAQCFWNQRSVDNHVPYHGFEKWLPLQKLTFVSNSISGRRFLAQRFGLPEQQVTLINNGLGAFHANHPVAFWQEKFGIKQHDTVLVMVANFFPEKDFATVIKGVHLLAQQGLPVTCIFAGGGGNSAARDQMKALAFDLQLNRQIIFAGSCKDVPGLLAACHIGVLSSLSEGCPNSILEYMQTPLPVVANNIEAISDVLGADYPFLFKTGDAPDFAQKVATLIQNKTMAEETARKLKKQVETNFNLQKMIDSFIALLHA